MPGISSCCKYINCWDIALNSCECLYCFTSIGGRCGGIMTTFKGRECLSLEKYYFWVSDLYELVQVGPQHIFMYLFSFFFGIRAIYIWLLRTVDIKWIRFQLLLQTFLVINCQLVDIVTITFCYWRRQFIGGNATLTLYLVVVCGLFQVN